MANEAILRDRLADPIDFTVADGTGIEKGAVLQLSDPRTAAAASSGAAIAGIAAREKVASDGRTRLAVFRQGIFDMTSAGAFNAGDAVKAAGSNKVVVCDVNHEHALGVALETAVADEVVQIELKPMSFNLA